MKCHGPKKGIHHSIDQKMPSNSSCHGMPRQHMDDGIWRIHNFQQLLKPRSCHQPTYAPHLASGQRSEVDCYQVQWHQRGWSNVMTGVTLYFLASADTKCRVVNTQLLSEGFISIIGKNVKQLCPGYEPSQTVCIIPDQPGRGERSGHEIFHSRSVKELTTVLLLFSSPYASFNSVVDELKKKKASKGFYLQP